MAMQVDIPRHLAEPKPDSRDAGAIALTDPVCGMPVTTKSFHTLEHGRQW